MGIDSDDSFAEEIVEIFVEEVGEVLEQIDENFPLWENNSANEAALKEVRRAFHTLKGSGRMVQAEEIGELSWAVENMLNRLIDKTLKINDSIYELVKEVRNIIPAMLTAFENKQAAALSGVNFTQMIDQANAIVEGKKVASIATFATAEPAKETVEHHQSEAFDSMLSTVDMVDIETLKGRMGELASSLDEIKRNLLSMSAKVNSLSTEVGMMPKSLDPVAITRQLETADKEIHELKYFMKATSEQMMIDVNTTQKRLSAKVDMELGIISDLGEQVTTEVAMVAVDLKAELMNQIKKWALGSAFGFSVVVLLISLFVK